MLAVLPLHEGLSTSTRLPGLARGARVSAAELAVLLLLGAGAALATAFLDFGLRIPGHAVLRAVFPMALGLALVPRRLAGSTMTAAALATAGCLHATGAAGFGAGAFTSLCLTGPGLDLAAAAARQGWRLYLGFALAGMGANLIAFGARAAFKLLGFDQPGMRRWEEWWPLAAGTYAACGLVAGLVSALVWFQLRARKQTDERQTE